MRVVALIPAAGAGTRLGSPKQFVRLRDVPLLLYALRACEAAPSVAAIVIAVPGHEVARVHAEVVSAYGVGKVQAVVAGGATRQDSVLAAWDAAQGEWDAVVVHDAARPCVTSALIERTIAVAVAEGAAVAALPATDTVRLSGDATRVGERVSRAGVLLCQTPQAFRAPLFGEAAQRARADRFQGTDDAALVERLGYPISLVPGDPRNIKVTTPEDLIVAAALLAGA